jgi:hypothetical protein
VGCWLVLKPWLFRALGTFIAAGPIMAALSGAAAGATTGGVVGALVGLGIPEYEAKAYEERLKTGGFCSPSMSVTARRRMIFAMSWKGMVSRIFLRYRRSNSKTSTWCLLFSPAASDA